MVMNLQLCFHNGMHLLAKSATLTSQQHLHSGREPPLQGIDVIMKIDVLCSLLESGSEQLRRLLPGLRWHCDLQAGGQPCHRSFMQHQVFQVARLQKLAKYGFIRADRPCVSCFALTSPSETFPYALTVALQNESRGCIFRLPGNVQISS